MPVINDTNLSRVRKANTVMSHALFTRAKKWLHPKICGSYDTTSLVEPHVITGSGPLMRKYNGKVYPRLLQNFTFNVPNELYKSFAEVDRTEQEGDQTGTLNHLAEQIGIRVAELPEYLWIKRVSTGDQTSSVTTIFKGITYTLTLDALPFFSLTHKLDGVTNQSNIITGFLPTTADACYSQDIYTTAQQMQSSLAKAIKAIKTVKDDQGAPIYASLDPKESIVVMVPASLENIARAAFMTPGTLAGSGGTGGGSGSSTSIGQHMVKDVICTGLLDGLPDVESDSLAMITPTYETQMYVFVVDDYVRPFYRQLFKPAGQSDLFPKGAGSDVDRMIADSSMADVKIDKAAATLYAGSQVEHNLDAVGSRATRDVVVQEKHFISGRSRMNFAYGPWFTGWKIDPVGTSL